MMMIELWWEMIVYGSEVYELRFYEQSKSWVWLRLWELWFAMLFQVWLGSRVCDEHEVLYWSQLAGVGGPTVLMWKVDD